MLSTLTLISALTVVTTSPLAASWAATDGFRDPSFISFDPARYQGMVNDQARTPVFAKAIRQALSGREGELVVLDIGTGPEALLALIAARAGAKKVYAIEAQPEVAELARAAIEASVAAGEVPAGVVEVLEGFSTSLELPEEADLLVSEIVGSIASGEGVYATMYDAQQRHLRAPHHPSSYIPLVVETLAAPMSYALHHPALGPKGFDWEAVRTKGPPPRFPCNSRAVQALAVPQRLECIRFHEPLPAPGSRLELTLAFEMCAERMRSAERDCFAELVAAGAPEEAAAQVAAQVGCAVSGVGMWPRLVLDEAESLVIESRGADGRAQRSHWQTVLPLLCAAPVRVNPGDILSLHATIDLGAAIDIPVRYALRGEIIHDEESADDSRN